MRTRREHTTAEEEPDHSADRDREQPATAAGDPSKSAAQRQAESRAHATGDQREQPVEPVLPPHGAVPGLAQVSHAQDGEPDGHDQEQRGGQDRGHRSGHQTGQPEQLRHRGALAVRWADRWRDGRGGSSVACTESLSAQATFSLNSPAASWR
jgi:hypothetical protein